MIICNLETILKERHLRISKVSADTGISRTTLTALCNNAGKGVQFETMNALCIYLNIKPDQLFTAVPFDISVEDVSWMPCDGNNLPDEAEVELLYSDRNRNECIFLTCGVLYYDYPEGNREIPIAEIRIAPLDRKTKEGSKNTQAEIELFLSAIRSLPLSALQIIKGRIGAAVASTIKFDGEHPKPYVVFPEQFSALGAFKQ